MGRAAAEARSPVNVLVVGAGPTGLALAAQVSALVGSVRIVERRAQPREDSRAFAVHSRILEALQPLGIAEALAARGTPGADLRLHFGERVVAGRLTDVEMEDTAYPFVLIIPQTEVEAVLEEHLAAVGIPIERHTTFVTFDERDDEVQGVVRGQDGRTAKVRARYLAGRDGADSTVRPQAGIGFPGEPYPRTLLLADLHVEGPLAPEAIHAYIGPRGMLFFFPLGSDATWRMLTARPRRPLWSAAGVSGSLSLDDLQRAADHYTDGLRLCRPERMDEIRLARRQANHYRSGRVFVAGDAAHVHSPAGAQGMNTGIQDACNLGWKLALAARGAAHDRLLDSYEQERRPVARWVRRLTDLAFLIEASENPVLGLGRTLVAPLVAPVLLRHRVSLRSAIRVASGLDVRYGAGAAVQEHRPLPRRTARAGARLPDARVSCNGQPAWLHMLLRPPGFHLLLCDPEAAWADVDAGDLVRRYDGLVTVRRLGPDVTPGEIRDRTGEAARRLGFRGPWQCLVRPDGCVAYACPGTDLGGVAGHLARMLHADRR